MSLSLNIRSQTGGWLSLLGAGLPLGRIAGVPVLLHWTWFVALIVELAFRRNIYESWLWNVAEYLALFLVVLLHELGHALACRSVGGRVDRIILWPLGGIVALYPPPRPWPTLWSIAGGPLVNALLLPLTIWLTFYVFEVRLFRGMHEDLPHFLLVFTILNAVMLAFNLLPFYPLDGGQILHALLWTVLGRALSLIIVSVLGILGAVAMAVLLVMYCQWFPGYGLYWLAMVPLFLLLQATIGLIYALFLRRPGWENLTAAVHYLQHDQPDRAIDECSRALERLGGDGGGRCMAHQRRGVAYLARGDLVQAAAELTQAIEVASHAALHYTWGEANLLLGEYHKAIDEFSEALTASSFRDLARHVQARTWYGRGEAHFHLGEHALAEEDLGKARDIDSLVPKIFFHPQDEDSRKRHVAWAIDACDVWLTIQTIPGAEACNLAATLGQQGKFEEAVNASTEAIRLNPRLALAYVNRGDALRQLGRLDEALADAEKALQLEPSSYFALVLRGAVRRLQGRHKEAVADCTAALRLNAKFVPAYMERLQAAFALEDFTRTEADSNTIMQLAPEVTIIYNFRGMARACLGRYAEAIADYEQAIRLHPEEALPYNNLAYLLATCPLGEVRDGPLALQHALRACELSEYAVPIILDTLATAQAEMGNFDEAIRWENTALEDAAFEKEYGDKARQKLREFQAGRAWHEGDGRRE